MDTQVNKQAAQRFVSFSDLLDGALQMSGMALLTEILVVTGSTFKPSVEGKPNSDTNSHAYSCTCTDTAYCCTNTYTNSRSDSKCEEPQVKGNTHLSFLVFRFMFHCMYSLDLLIIIALWQSTPPQLTRFLLAKVPLFADESPPAMCTLCWVAFCNTTFYGYCLISLQGLAILLQHQPELPLLQLYPILWDSN